MSDDLLDALQARLDALGQRADPGPVLEQRAVEEVRALLDQYPPADDGGDRPEALPALLTAALVHWARHCLGSAVEDDLTAAAGLLSRVHRQDPTAVPEPLLLLVDTADEEDEDTGPMWPTMADTFLTRYMDTGDIAALRTAVQLLSAGLDAAFASDERAWVFSRFTAALFQLYEHTGDQDVLDTLITTARAETTTATPRHAGLAWSVLSIAVMARATRTGSADDLIQAAQDGRKAVELTADDAPHYDRLLVNLAAVLTEQAYYTNDPDALYEARSLLRTAVDRSGSDDAERPVRLHNLAIVLRGIGERTGDPTALDEAVKAARQATALANNNQTLRTDTRRTLVATLLLRFRITGELETLTGAIGQSREALSDLRADHPALPAMAAQLGEALYLFYQHTGDSLALAEAVNVLRTAIERTPADHSDRSRYLSNLAAVLKVRYEHSGDQADLDAAIDLLRSATAELPPDRPERATYLSNLGNALRARHERTGDSLALAEAVNVLRTAIERTPADHSDRSRYLSNLAAVLKVRYEHSGDQADLDAAIDLLRSATAELPPDRPERATYLSNLGNALRARHTGDREENQRAGRQALQEASTIANASLLTRTRSAWAYGDAALRDGDASSALDAFTDAVQMLSRIAPRSLARADREHRLGRFVGLGSDAAATALTAGQPELAVVLLEQSRGVLLGEALAANTEADDLRRHHPALHAKFNQLREALSDPEVGPEERRWAATAFDETITRIRALPGFACFLHPDTIDDLRPPDGAAPIVVVNVSVHRSDALIITSAADHPVQAVPLPQLTPPILAAQVDRLLKALPGHPVGEEAMSATLAWLWDAVVEPVLTALGIDAPPPTGQPWPQLSWCPVGLLACLPLHAAGRYGKGTALGASALDRVVSSYTPTVRAVAYARRRSASHSPQAVGHPHSALVVAAPHTPAAPPLPYAQTEAEFVGRVLPGATTLIDASRNVVLAALGQFSVLHFACHGVTDWHDASASRLLLRDGELSVRDLQTHHLDNANLVVLSACSTSVSHAAPTDEVVHLTSAFLAAGAQHVVGTLWAVLDNVAAKATTHLYTLLTEDGTRPPRIDLTASSLHQTARWLREEHPGSPSIWATFVHVGT